MTWPDDDGGPSSYTSDASRAVVWGAVAVILLALAGAIFSLLA